MRYIIGIGSHAEMIYSILKEQAEPVAFVSFPSRLSERDLSAMVLEAYHGGLDELADREQHEFVVAIGDNLQRRELVRANPGLKYINVIHPTAQVAKTVRMGVGNVICAGAVVQASTRIGNHCIISMNVSVDHNNTIHDFCLVAPNCALCGHVTLYEGVTVGVGSSVLPSVRIRALQEVRAGSTVKESTGPLPMYEPYLARYKQSAMEAIESGWISCHGKYIRLASDKLKHVLRCKHVVLTSNGTTATHALFLALRFKHPEVRRVYVPDSVYVAAWNSALTEFEPGALRVLPVDPATWNMPTDEGLLAQLEHGAALLVVHNLGNVVDVRRLKRLRPDLVLLEDNCEGFLGRYGPDAYTGASDAVLCSSVSFFGNKTLTTGEGGAVLTAHTDVYEYLARVCAQGMSARRYVHDVHAYNYRMTNVQAAFLYDQLRDVQHITELKRAVFDRYTQLLQPLIRVGRVRLQAREPDTEPAQWMYALRLVGCPSFDLLYEYMLARGVDTRPIFYPVETHAHLRSLQRLPGTDRTASDELSREGVMLPSYPTLRADEQAFVVDALMGFVREHMEGSSSSTGDSSGAVAASSK